MTRVACLFLAVGRRERGQDQRQREGATSGWRTLWGCGTDEMSLQTAIAMNGYRGQGLFERVQSRRSTPLTASRISCSLYAGSARSLARTLTGYPLSPLHSSSNGSKPFTPMRCNGHWTGSLMWESTRLPPLAST